MSNNENEKLVSEFLTLCEQLLSCGEYQQLMTLCLEYSQFSDDESVYAYLTCAAFTLGELDIAENAARNGMRLNDKNPDHYYNLACIMKSKRRFSNAWRFFNRTEILADDELKSICKQEKQEIEQLLKTTPDIIIINKLP